VVEALTVDGSNVSIKVTIGGAVFRESSLPIGPETAGKGVDGRDAKVRGRGGCDCGGKGAWMEGVGRDAREREGGSGGCKMGVKGRGRAQGEEPESVGKGVDCRDAKVRERRV
jgi:hypothetical protein